MRSIGLLLWLLVGPSSALSAGQQKASRKQQQRKPPPSPRNNRRSKRQQTSPLSVPLRTQLDYARNGHCVLRSILHIPQSLLPSLRQLAFDRELVAWQQKVQVASRNKVKRPCRTVRECQQALREILGEDVDLPFLQYFHTWREVPSVLTLAQQLAPLAADLMDCSTVRLYQDALFWKRRGDGPTPWHSDARMAPFDTNRLVTLWIPLQDIAQDGSALQFVSGSHNDFALAYWNEEWDNLETRYGEPVHYMPLEVGDVTAHAGWTLHCANDASDDERWALAITYVDAAAVLRVLGGNDRMDDEDRWSYEEWVQEMVGMRTMLAKWANVSEFDIFGMRAPRLKPGDNRQFDVSDRCSAGVL